MEVKIRFCPHCYQRMTKHYDQDLDIAYLTGKIAEQFVVLECSNDECKMLVPIPERASTIHYRTKK